MASDRREASALSIGLFTPRWPVGAGANGIMTYVGVIAEQLRLLGHRTTVVASGVTGPDTEAYAVAQALRKLDRHPIAGGLYRAWGRISPVASLDHRYSRALISTVRRAADERGLDIFEMEESFGAARVLCDSLRIPVCIRLHGPWFLNGRALGVKEDAAYWRRVEREGRAIRRAAGVTSPSLDTLEKTREFYKIPLPNAEVIPSAASPCDTPWRPEEADPKQVLFVGRFDRHKGGDVMIDAFAKVLVEEPDARLCFVGPDRGCADEQGRTWQLEEYVREKIPGALESGRVQWLGFQPSSALPALRRKALVTVVCSRYENLPLAVLEAMAMGCPIVASGTGGIPELIDGTTNGLLHKPGDPEDLAAHIMTFLREPALAAAVGARAAAYSRDHLAPAHLAARTADFYTRVLDGWDSRG